VDDRALVYFYRQLNPDRVHLAMSPIGPSRHFAAQRNWSSSGHSGLWQAVSPADLWVHGLVFSPINDFSPRSRQTIALRAITIWALARFMLTAGWIDNYQLNYECIRVLSAALLYALRVINECEYLLGGLGYHPDLLRALIYAR
jgi:hypothetical protein